MIVAIDGPSGVGKSTLGRALAARLGCPFVESGAMYRAVGLMAIENRTPADDASAVIGLAEKADIRFVETSCGIRVHLNGRDVTERIRSADVTDAASIVSTIPGVRDLLVAQQRAIGSSPRGVVMEGRDIGTVVFPEADLKIYLDAAADIRTTRRIKDRELGEASPESVVREQIETRDHRDRTRKASPMMAAADAVHLDSSQLTAEEVLEKVWAMLKPRVAS
jgi:CMP/dCMP kinase